MKMKQWVVSLMLTFALVFGLTVTAPTAHAEYTGVVGSVVQTDATYTSVTVQWTPVSDATGYNVKVNGTLVASVDAATTNYTVSGLTENSIQLISVTAMGIDASTGQSVESTASQSLASCYGHTLSRVSGVNYDTDYSNVYGFNYASPYTGLTVRWNGCKAAAGYEAVLYNKSGKKVQTLYVDDYAKCTYQTFTKAKRTQVYYVRVRSYINVSGGKVYGDYSNKFYAVPQPVVTSTERDISRTSVKVRWKKVSGASSYSIYKSTNKNKLGKKVATVSGNKTSYKMTGLNFKKHDYYVRIVTNAKVNGKTKKSLKAYGTRFYVTFY
jgi:hypothetical protein